MRKLIILLILIPNLVAGYDVDDLLLADEPTGALDSKTSYEVMDLIQKINDLGNTILVVTHEPDIADMCKRIVHLKDGVIVEDKKVKQVRAAQYV